MNTLKRCRKNSSRCCRGEIYQYYLAIFPEDERKPLKLIQSSYEKHYTTIKEIYTDILRYLEGVSKKTLTEQLRECEIFIGSPLSVKFALKAMPPQKNSPMMVETAIICATVGIMCPLMSFLATILYNGIIACGMYHEITVSYLLINFIPFWLQKVVLNFPFALLSQLFFIQPLTRTIFKKIFVKQSKEYNIENEKELIEDTETIPEDIK